MPKYPNELHIVINKLNTHINIIYSKYIRILLFNLFPSLLVNPCSGWLNPFPQGFRPYPVAERPEKHWALPFSQLLREEHSTPGRSRHVQVPFETWLRRRTASEALGI